jgi:hypothetical protein
MTIKAVSAIYRQRSIFVWSAYWILWGALYVFYSRLSQAWEPHRWTGALPASWWLLAVLYIVINTALVVVPKLIIRKLDTGGAKKSKLYEIADIVPSWLLMHIVFLFFQYPVSIRLEASGLGILELLVFIALITLLIGDVVKSRTTPSKPDND